MSDSKSRIQSKKGDDTGRKPPHAAYRLTKTSHSWRQAGQAIIAAMIREFAYATFVVPNPEKPQSDAPRHDSDSSAYLALS
jgi:hypothetical protein